MAEVWLVVYVNNSPPGDGFFVFKPEAMRFKKYLEKRGATVDMVGFDRRHTLARRRTDVLSAAKRHVYDHAAVFCHGWETGLQCGLRPGDWVELLTATDAIHRLTFYACSAGEGPGVGGEGGYADRVREALAKYLMVSTVLAHRTAGHATRNPTLAVFDTMHLDDGGVLVAPPSDKKWKAWLNADEHRFLLALHPHAYGRGAA